jgi:hypothetical protein
VQRTNDSHTDQDGYAGTDVEVENATLALAGSARVATSLENLDLVIETFHEAAIFSMDTESIIHCIN